MVSEVEVDYLYNIDKVITEDWIWDEAPGCLEAEVDVICLGSDAELTMKGWMSTQIPNNYQFSLLYQNTITVRRWDDKERGITNDDGTRITGSHKHKWKSQEKDTEVYPVDDITTDDVEQAFYDFLDECDINHKGQFDPQSRLTYYDLV